jgi:hypothetical protein
MLCCQTARGSGTSRQRRRQPHQAIAGDRLLDVGPLSPLDFPTLAPNTLTAVAHRQAEQAAAKRRSKPLSNVVGLYLKEKALDKTERTLSAKR